jgi:anti-sigma factor RsiW
MTCETARELLPELSAGVLAGGLDVALESALERHLERCASCAAEAEVVALVRAAAVVPPPGLEARVARAVRSGAVTRRPLVAVRSLAVAATAAFALLTGGLLLRDFVGDDAEPGLAEVTLGWPVVQDPILRAAPALHDLSVEELESLLAELES